MMFSHKARRIALSAHAKSYIPSALKEANTLYALEGYAALHQGSSKIFICDSEDPVGRVCTYVNASDVTYLDASGILPHGTPVMYEPDAEGKNSWPGPRFAYVSRYDEASGKYTLKEDSLRELPSAFTPEDLTEITVELTISSSVWVPMPFPVNSVANSIRVRGYVQYFNGKNLLEIERLINQLKLKRQSLVGSAEAAKDFILPHVDEKTFLVKLPENILKTKPEA